MSTNQVEKFLNLFMVAWQVARIYELKHPKFKIVLDEAHEMLSVLLGQSQELIIGLFGDELASGTDIFFDLSRKVIASIDYLQGIGIEKITFTAGIEKQELIDFIEFLMVPRERIDRPAQEYLALKGVEHVSVDKISGSPVGKKNVLKDIEVKLLHYNACVDNAANIFNLLLEDSTVDSLRLQFISKDIMKYFMGDHRIFLELAKVKGHDSTTFSHLVNVSTLAVYFAYRLGFSRQDCLDISIAALFHDIGKLMIAKKILQKPGQLDSEEFLKIKSHTVLGAKMLTAHRDVLGELPAVVAFEHHRNFDGSGYPQLPFSGNNHITSSMVALCDVYDALTSRRTYKRDYPPEAIYQLMLRERGKRYHPQLFDAFFRMMGVWPKGAIVCLSNERIAVVRQTNDKAIFSPLVEVVSQQPRIFIDLSEQSGIKIERTLNTLSEGADYLAFI